MKSITAPDVTRMAKTVIFVKQIARKVRKASVFIQHLHKTNKREKGQKTSLHMKQGLLFVLQPNNTVLNNHPPANMHISSQKYKELQKYSLTCFSFKLEVLRPGI